MILILINQIPEVNVMKYSCQSSECDMQVKGLVCAKCDTQLLHDSIVVDGNNIGVSKCPTCDGMIKSPQCCGEDMLAI